MEEEVPFLLHLFDELKIKATFFVSGEVMSKYPEIIHDIKEHGHELASHGFKHNVDYRALSKIKLHDQISRSKKVLEDEIGVTPIGFRAPQFQINNTLYHKTLV